MKKIIKKNIIFLLSIILLFTCVVACGDKSSNAAVTPPPQEIYEQLVKAELFDPPYLTDIWESNLGDYKVEPDDAVSFVAKEAAISAVFVQLIMIEAGEGRLNDVHNAMLTHQSKLKDDAFYPQGAKAAAASIVGVSGNLVYLICDERAVQIEEELLKFIG